MSKSGQSEKAKGGRNVDWSCTARGTGWSLDSTSHRKSGRGGSWTSVIDGLYVFRRGGASYISCKIHERELREDGIEKRSFVLHCIGEFWSAFDGNVVRVLVLLSKRWEIFDDEYCWRRRICPRTGVQFIDVVESQCWCQKYTEQTQSKKFNEEIRHWTKKQPSQTNETTSSHFSTHTHHTWPVNHTIWFENGLVQKVVSITKLKKKTLPITTGRSYLTRNPNRKQNSVRWSRSKLLYRKTIKSSSWQLSIFHAGSKPVITK